MKSLKHAVTVLVLASGFALVGCQEKGPMEEAGETIDEAAEDTGEAMEEAGEDAKDAVDQ